MAVGWVVWTALVAAMPSPGDDVRDAVAGLSAPRRADRERAARRLEAIGEAAAPALREAAESNDLELRAQAAAVLDVIEGQAIGRPTPVTLDFNEVPLAEVVDAVTDRTGLGLILGPGNDPRRGGRKVTVVAEGPVSFWEAVERIGKAAEVRPDFSGNANVGFNRGMIGMPNIPGGMAPRRPARPVTGNEVVLVPDTPAPPPPTARSGRFLVALTALNHHRDRTLPGPGGRPAGSVTDRFEAKLQVAPEPDLMVGRVGDVEGLEAEDDHGQTLVPAGPVVEEAPNPYTPYNVYGVRTNTAASVALRYPDRPGTQIRRLRGVLPVTVVGIRPDPVTASLVEGLGQPVRKGDVTLTVHEVRPVPEAVNIRVVELSLTRPEGAGPNGFGGFSRPMIAAPPGAAQGWFEFVDEKGRPLTRVAASPIPGDDAQRRSLRVVEGQGRSVAVRYLAPAWSTLSVPFEFHDLPMP
jgi:hypothetical protein